MNDIFEELHSSLGIFFTVYLDEVRGFAFAARKKLPYLHNFEVSSVQRGPGMPL